MQKSVKGRTVQWQFEPRKIYAFLTEKVVVDKDLLEPAVLDAMGGITTRPQTPEEEALDDHMFSPLPDV